MLNLTAEPSDCNHDQPQLDGILLDVGDSEDSLRLQHFVDLDERQLHSTSAALGDVIWSVLGTDVLLEQAHEWQPQGSHGSAHNAGVGALDTVNTLARLLRLLRDEDIATPHQLALLHATDLAALGLSQGCRRKIWMWAVAFHKVNDIEMYGCRT